VDCNKFKVVKEIAMTDIATILADEDLKAAMPGQ